MIKRLHIRNYAIIEELEINFSNGLTIITGETGAGKSILLGALGLIMGNRADTKSLYNTEEKCVIEGFFDIRQYDLKAFFEENDLEYDTELIVRRDLLPSGKSRAYVNDMPVNLTILQQLSSSLIDLHQQFDTLDIHEVSFQLRMIDALAGNTDLLKSYQLEYRSYVSDKNRLEKLLQRNEAAAKEMDFLNFQMEEFNAAELIDGEQEELEEELERLTNAEDIKRNLAGVFQHLSESEPSVIGQLEDMLLSVNEVRNFDLRIEKLDDRLTGVLEELKDMAQELEAIAEDTEYDPERIQEIQERLDMIYRLQKKHSVQTVAELLEIQNDIEKQLGEFSDLSDEIETLQIRIQEKEDELLDKANVLSERRRTVVPDFESRIQERLAQLAMEHAQLKVEFHATEELTPTGKDEVNYMFAANKGSRLQLIKDVASGGELSRLTLVTKSLVASSIPLPTLIFDEIDSGISGHVSLKMGDILRKLSNEHQVVSITHSPQIASKADAHYFVYKEVREDRTVTNVKLLTENERIQNIATMLSTNPPTDSAIENAKELLSYA